MDRFVALRALISVNASQRQRAGIGMNQDRYTGIFKQVRGTIRQAWGKQHAGRVQARRGLAQEQAARSLRDFFSRNHDWDLSNR
jgi:uncharacterized protein YjbJ (UPF0337 family)